MASHNISMFIDETGLDEESKILAISCIITSDSKLLRTKLNELKQELVKDIRFRDIPSIKNLEKRGFHYCEDHQEVRAKVIDLIATLPFEAYICYQHKRNGFCPSGGFNWYDQLFGKLIHDRLRKYTRSSITICFEQHGSSPTIRQQELENIVKRLVEEIKLRDIVDFPGIPVVKSAGKEEPCLAVADYVAAIFKSYEAVVMNVEETERRKNLISWEKRYFSMLRQKIRVIHNYDTKEFFTRRKPFP